MAEDELNNARLLLNILRNNQHTVEVVPDNANALLRKREDKFDTLLTDSMMLGIDGVTLI